MDTTALLIVDVQYDFLPPDGSLAVQDGLDILPHIRELLASRWDWKRVVASQDYHPLGHISFASSHPGNEPFTTITVQDKQGKNIQQILWPDHCIQGTKGSEIESSLVNALHHWKSVERFFLVQKGSDKDLDAYSAFATPSSPSTSLSQNAPSPLGEYLQKAGVQQLVICGIATDVCVRATALDALQEGYKVILVEEACKGVDGGKVQEVLSELQEKGARLARTVEDLRGMLSGQ